MNFKIALLLFSTVPFFSQCSDNDQNIGGGPKHIDGHVRWVGSEEAVPGAMVEANTIRMFSMYDIHGSGKSNEDGYYSISFEGYVPTFQIDVVNMDRNPIVRMESEGREATNVFEDKDSRIKLDFFLQAFGTAEVLLNKTGKHNYNKGVLKSSYDSLFIWMADTYDPIFLKLRAEMEDSVELRLYSGAELIMRTSTKVRLKNSGIAQVRFDL
ncbi:MAG: hypothetical protein H6606_09530 [Flavobacteriales bacterium]|nr:hypothetical protein [Flavobacteriales bacterium]